MAIHNYKILREELNEILIRLEIPKHYFYTLAELTVFLFNNRKDSSEYHRAVEIIHEISPIPLNILKGE